MAITSLAQFKSELCAGTIFRRAGKFIPLDSSQAGDYPSPADISGYSIMAYTGRFKLRRPGALLAEFQSGKMVSITEDGIEGEWEDNYAYAAALKVLENRTRETTQDTPALYKQAHYKQALYTRQSATSIFLVW